MPVALICALDATDYEDTVRNAVWLGGDSDTIACIAGGLAEVLFGVPAAIAGRARSHLTPDLLEEGWVLTCQSECVGRGVKVEYPD